MQRFRQLNDQEEEILNKMVRRGKAEPFKRPDSVSYTEQGVGGDGHPIFTICCVLYDSSTMETAVAVAKRCTYAGSKRMSDAYNQKIGEAIAFRRAVRALQI